MAILRNRRTRRLLALAAVVLGSLTVYLVTRSTPAPYQAGEFTEGLTDALGRALPADAPAFAFTDVTGDAGLSCTHFPGQRTGLLSEDMGSGVALADVDGDGHCDALIMNIGTDTPAPTRLFRNRGDGTFEDRSESSGIAFDGIGMAATFCDTDSDGDLDLWLSSYGGLHLYRNEGDCHFTDISAAAGLAEINGFFAGLAPADYDRDGDLDFFVTHWLAQENALYTNHLSEMGPERMMFGDVADMVGLGHTGLSSVGWGTAFLDYDNDGWVDLFVANGSTLEQRDNDELLVPQKMQLFWNRGLDGYYDATLIAGPGLAHPWVARGAAAADWDRDGDVDLAVSVNGGPLLLLENQGPVNGHWIEIDLRQPGGNRRALGALIRVVTDIATQLGAVGANSSYLSQEPTTRHFGVGQTDLVEVQVRWPDGTEEVWLELAADQSVVLDRGTGTILAR